MKNTKIKAAVVLSGCGYLDGTEVREAVLSLLVFEQKGVEVSFFAPDINIETVNHITNKIVKEKRNALVESARIARGNISNLEEIDSENFDMLVLPGGYGMVKNLSDLAQNKDTITVVPKLEKIILEFFNAKKPIGGICISPAVIVAILSNQKYDNDDKVKVTIGDDTEKLISKIGGEHIKCDTELSIEDKDHNVFSCSAYMRQDENLFSVYQGIKHMIEGMIKQSNSR